MIALLWLFLLPSSSSVDLVDEAYQVPAHEWRWVEVSLRQQPALLSARIEPRAGAGDIRVALLRREELERLRHDRMRGVLAATAPGEPGLLSYHLREPGEYAVVLDNRDGDAPATAHLRVWLDFAPTGPNVMGLSRQRQLTVILISFGVFFGIVTWSARRLLRSIRP